MGVHGLWELLSTVARRVSVETLRGKILAIDASIWIVQFLNAMKDDSGKILKNSHLIGTTRRILKLLFHGIVPVFVFDGATPTLKIRTVRARRVLRERHEQSLKKVAEKILLTRLKSRIDPKSKEDVDSASVLSSVSNATSVLQPDNVTNVEVALDGSEDEWENGYTESADKLIDSEARSDYSGSDTDGQLWGLPEDCKDIDGSVLSSLPEDIRKTVIEEARKKESRRKRTNYLPVAENPLLYSQTQIANFLRSSQLNKLIEKSQEKSKSSTSVNLVLEDSESSGVTYYSAAGGVSEEGGFLHVPEKDTVLKKIPRVEGYLSEWKCEDCTLYNSVAEAECALCGRTRGSPVAETVSQSQDGPASCKYDTDGTDDSWEDNDHDEESARHDERTEGSARRNHILSHSNDVSSYNVAHTTGSDKGQPSECSSDLVNRAVSSARNMGDWAGRAVHRALKSKSLVGAAGPEKTVRSVEPIKTHDGWVSHKDEEYRGSNFSQILDDTLGVAGSDEKYSSSSKDRGGQGGRENLGSELTEEMKQLLDAFDIPYITAPYEAEAQCAYLEQMGLVSGVVTEDSDAFLFGAERVYKNIFNDKKFVEAYFSEDVRRDLGLSRGDLIALAYLLGSDYTEGVKGIGIVNAMEVINAFGWEGSESNRHGDCSLELHREGIQLEQDGSSSSVDQCPRISVTPISDNNLEATLAEVLCELQRFRHWLEDDFDFDAAVHSHKPDVEFTGDAEDIREDNPSTFNRRHSTGRTQWTVSAQFPDRKIGEAYLKPEVHKSSAPFVFEKPKLFKVKKYCEDVLGWTENEIADQVVPVVKRCLLTHSDQTRIDNYYVSYHDNSKVASIQSQRLKAAVESRVSKKRKRRLK